MIFTLEALKAGEGDCLLVHYATSGERTLVVIDGGPSGTYRDALEPRLRQLRDARTPDDELLVELAVVTHVDTDHAVGVVDLIDGIVHADAPYAVRQVWINTFDDVVPAGSKAWSAGAEPATVGHGRTIRDFLAKNGLDGNGAFDGPVLADSKAAACKLAAGLTFTVLAPTKARLDELQEAWDAYLVEKKVATVEVLPAGIEPDDSEFNLSSIGILAEATTRVDGREVVKRMLLTGDALASDLYEGLKRAGKLDTDGRCHVDVLKLPHHGSARNVTPEFLAAVTADHYVVSANGRHGNCDVATFEMLLEARGKAPGIVHLTHALADHKAKYPAAQVRALFDQARKNGAGLRLKEPDAASGVSPIVLDLGLPYDGK